MRNRYWHSRLERWGAWRVGANGVAVAPWARMRNGMPMRNDDPDHVPQLHIEERETAELVTHLAPDQARFVGIVYPWRARLASVLGISRQTLEARLDTVHRRLARLLDQRRRGETLDAERPRPRPKVQRIRVQAGKRQRLVAVAVEE